MEAPAPETTAEANIVFIDDYRRRTGPDTLYLDLAILDGLHSAYPELGEADLLLALERCAIRHLGGSTALSIEDIERELEMAINEGQIRPRAGTSNSLDAERN